MFEMYLFETTLKAQKEVNFVLIKRKDLTTAHVHFGRSAAGYVREG